METTTLPLRETISAFQCGMIVRFPIDRDAENESFRDFRVGSIQSLDEDTASAQVTYRVVNLSEKSGGRSVSDEVLDVPLRHLSRCRLLPETTFSLRSSNGAAGKVLIACTDEFPKSSFVEYYALFGGRVQRVSEAEIALFSSSRQDLSPVEQALGYELQNPGWRQPRDEVVTFTGELRSVTYGIEDLVGSRVLLLAHQAEVVSRALSSPECRLMLADEVGLGKTIEAAVVLKALRRRDPTMRALIIAPSALTGQWRNELSQKFWLDVPVIQPGGGQVNLAQNPVVIISAEDLVAHELYWEHLSQRDWGLLIVDEAHHLRKTRALYDRVLQLSERTARVLALTATPIQRRADEYLDLLKLLDPRRYGSEDVESFRRLVEAQERVRAALALVRPQLNEASFDWEEFSDDVGPLMSLLRNDSGLGTLAETLASQEDDPDAALETARQIAAYISANYRIESRMVRNRRASLDIELPTRACSTTCSYDPGESERSLLEDLYEHAGSYIAQTKGAALGVELARLLLHSAASSPHALLSVLRWRAEALRDGLEEPASATALTTLAAPRREQARIRQLAQAAPAVGDELAQIERLIRRAELWLDECELALAGVRRATVGHHSNDRLAQALRDLRRVRGPRGR